jgi:hypothetical protein
VAVLIEVVASVGEPSGEELRVRVDLGGERMTVRALLEQAVIAQIAELLERQKQGREAALRTLARRYMTDADIAAQLETGAVRFPVPGPTELFEVKSEVAKAWHGFERRAFRVFVDGEMVQSLDDEVVLTAESKVTFLRLVPLKGG